MFKRTAGSSKKLFNDETPEDRVEAAPNENALALLWRELVFNRMPLLHLVICILLATSMTCWLDGYLAILPTTPRSLDRKLRLRVSDITTIISSVLTLIKILVGAWTGTVLWNSLFLLLESPGLKFRQINGLFSFHLPPFSKNLTTAYAWLLLLLVVPQQFISPLLSGAVDWGYGFEFSPDLAHVSAGSSSVNPLMWYWYGTSPDTRRSYVRRAAAYATMAWDNSTADRGHCRHIMDDEGIHVNSSALNVVIPCLQIHSITFPTSLLSATLWDVIYSGVFERNDSLSRSGDPPLAYYVDGNSVLFDPDHLPANGSFPPKTQMPPYEMDLPSNYIHSGPMIAVVMINGTVPLNGRNCTDVDENIFGMSSFNNIFTPVQYGLYYRCVTYAVVNLTAGMTLSPSSTYISSRVIESDQNADAMELIPGPWVQEAMYLMPDVMSAISMMNSTPLATWDNLETYTTQLIRYSFQSSLDMLSRSFQPNISTIPVRVYEQRQKAVVSRQRVYSWLGISSLLTISCVVLMIRPNASKRKRVVDGQAAALMMDPSKVLEKIGWDLTSLSSVSSSMNKDVGPVIMKYDEANKGYFLETSYSSRSRPSGRHE